jgi:hypothetical protein
MTAAPDLDGLIDRLKRRASDPARRTSNRPTEFGRAVGSLDLGGLISMAGDLASMLKGVVDANRAGRVDAAGHARAQELERQISTPVDEPLPAPADEPALARAEAELGVALPPVLRRVYAEVADGGFGPGDGLLSLEGIVARYRELRSPGMMPRGREWPTGVVPLVSVDPGWTCVETTTGRILDWDPEELNERSSEDRFRRSFRPEAASVEAWLSAWLGAKTAAEQRDEMMARLMSPESQVAQARQAREAMRRKTPEERAAMGLPAVGWEKVVWGGIGWDEETGEG